MPLKLIELVLPWLVGSLGEGEAKSFLQNMHVAGWISILKINLSICYNIHVICVFLLQISNCTKLMQLQLLILRWLLFFPVGHVKVVRRIFVYLQVPLVVVLQGH